jgi:hypothetical protein
MAVALIMCRPFRKQFSPQNRSNPADFPPNKMVAPQ